MCVCVCGLTPRFLLGAKGWGGGKGNYHGYGYGCGQYGNSGWDGMDGMGLGWDEARLWFLAFLFRAVQGEKQGRVRGG